MIDTTPGATSVSSDEINEIERAMTIIEQDLAQRSWRYIGITKVYAEVMDVDGEVYLGTIALHHSEDPAAFAQNSHLIFDDALDDTPEPGPGRHLVLVDDDDHVIGRFTGVYDQEKDRD